MTRPLRSVLFLLVGATSVGIHAVIIQKDVQKSVQQKKGKTMHQAAAAFLASLTPEQIKRTRMPFQSDERLNWHYVPKERQGLSFKAMTPIQQELALDLLQISLSDRGFHKVATIRKLENILGEIEKGKGPVRDPELYYVTLFGDPAAKGVWGWRFEGHHVSLHWTSIEGKIIASTPQFLGANPAEVRSGPMQGTRALGAEEDLGRELLLSLSEAQRQQAVLSSNAPPDIITGNSRKVAILEDKGLIYKSMTHAQQGLLLSLIQEHAAAQTGPMAKKRLDAIRHAGLDSVKFAWMGSMERGKGHYYRIQGPAFLIEYDNTQNNANHIHAVWRDFKGDFGVDLLELHYRAHRHEP